MKHSPSQSKGTPTDEDEYSRRSNDSIRVC